MRLLVPIIVFSLCCPLTVLAQSSSSTVICKKNSNGALTLRSKRCKSGEAKVTNISSLTGATGATGAQGATGSQGADGSLRIYGDSSAGALSVTGTVTWVSTEALGQYTDCSIAAGATLTVPTGTVLRCSGSFTNNGAITVSTPYSAAQIGSISASGGIYPSYTGPSAPALGWGRTAASNAGYGSDAAIVLGGSAGFGLNTRFAANILRPGPIGGGSGGAGVGSVGAFGGGTLTVLAQGPLVNNGTIRADGSDAGVAGSGGGAGGMIILASKVSVSHEAAGVLEVDGGAGGASDASRGSGGGGGGGLIHILAPTINMVGSTSILGGVAGSSATNVTNSTRSGGGGGGSMIGAGGAGGNVQTSNLVTGTTAGGVGLVIQTLTDPTSLF